MTQTTIALLSALFLGFVFGALIIQGKHEKEKTQKTKELSTMTRFEIIKSMNIDEMSVFLQDIHARGYVECAFDIEREPINRKWLESEAEPYESINTKIKRV